LLAAPKLYVSPVVEEPVPAVYVVFAPVPDSAKVHPFGVVLEVLVFASVLKFSHADVPGVVRLIVGGTLSVNAVCAVHPELPPVAARM
jgi:hypothetical protein